MRLANKRVIITGGNRGIGRAITERFLKEGARVALLVRRDVSPFIKELTDKGYSVQARQTDITDYEQVKQAIDAIVQAWGGVDILVNNAAIISREGVLDMSLKAWHEVMDVNVNAAFYCSKAVIPYLSAQRSGTILNISSVAAKCGDITAAPAYGTSKGALTTFTRSLARQLAPYQVRVNAIAPHAIVTEMSAQWSDEKRKQVISAIPLGRMGTVEEVASTALFLASNEASFITGETVNINGGYLMD
ncbi:SDR family NAD(P)-dependent oxidoreductase [Sphaerochaeta globosa]|jgi:3-oxoacyl-[acyl-carrier protein] reductase|uniref:3-oxoacyl-(Acyl-carrier-protein) reductase n=1 Tax=Sphaerochaeta globosa (strain ATCC BAA-1886 / DSM 22777 / Buddy) TaxID=158189 RepID=F0RZC8_SPHGB|nr:SDR family NAD(P)-dependent oxidoreductase [Sphaerochaeta globosa]ADY13480.1 3-oxoacyl-(acyl-carrier-protein) reductase [Sphaerochaeta globosa str. Buddy]